MRKRQRNLKKPIPHGTSYGYNYWRCRCGRCRTAHALAVKRWWKAKTVHYRSYRLFRKYGITQADYDQMFRKQKGRCAMCRRRCKTKRNLAVDHCHKTNRVRELLCAPCNLHLGWYEANRRQVDRYIATHRNLARIAKAVRNGR